MKNKITNFLLATALTFSTGYCCNIQPKNLVPNARQEPTGEKMKEYQELEDIMKGVVCIRQETKYKSLLNEKVTVTTKGYGTAFTIGQTQGHTYLVTNTHTLKSAPFMMTEQGPFLKQGASRIFLPEHCAMDKTPENDLEALIVGFGGETEGDLGMIKTKEQLYVSQSFGMKPVKLRDGEDAYIIGYPQGRMKVLTKGIISNKDDDGHFITDGKATFGNSGSPLFIKRNNSFYLGGVVDSVMPTADGQNAYLTRGIPNKKVLSFIKRMYGK